MTSENNNQIRISAKNLGYLQMPGCCKRCFYIKLKLNQKLPWQIFPGIFSSIDSYSKNITWSYFEKYGQVPKWFSPYGDFIEPARSKSICLIIGLIAEVYLLQNELNILGSLKSLKGLSNFSLYFSINLSLSITFILSFSLN